MATLPKKPTQAEESPHRYQATADILSAHFEQPIVADIDRQAHVELPEAGGYRYQLAEPFQLHGVLSYASGYTHVSGHPSPKPQGFATLATSAIENLNVFDVLTADRVVGQISTFHLSGDGNVPSVTFLGTRFENLRIGGNKIEVERVLGILGPKPEGDQSYFEDAGVRDRIAQQYAAISKNRHLPDWAADAFRVDHEMKDQRMKFSLVRTISGVPGTSFGHVIDLPNFGRIFLGEVTVERKDNAHVFHLSMMRLEFDSIAKGSVRVANVECNGGGKTESRRENEQSYDLQELGPEYGLVTERLAELDLSTAIPGEDPPVELVHKTFLTWAHDSGATPELKRANVWCAALETQVLYVSDGRQPAETVVTTYGFLWTGAGVRLGVIHYLEPQMAFRANQPRPIEIMGWTFPVITRPWLPTQHRGRSSHLDGNCWVKFADEDGARQLGILTARHTLMPGSTRRPPSVRFDVLRPTPPKGRLHRLSERMDAALVAIDEGEWEGKVAVQHSRVVGFKPVRLITGHGTVDADIVEHQGFTSAAVPAEPGKEPLSAVLMFFNRSGEPGDSGCLVVDLEFAEQVGPRPYLIYLGKYGSRNGAMGYGLLIEQANRVWGLECYMNANPERM